MPKRIIEECANCNGQGDVKHMFKFKGVMICSDSCADTYEEWLLDKAWEEEEDKKGTVFIGPDRKITGWRFEGDE